MANKQDLDLNDSRLRGRLPDFINQITNLGRSEATEVDLPSLPWKGKLVAIDNHDGSIGCISFKDQKDKDTVIEAPMEFALVYCGNQLFYYSEEEADKTFRNIEVGHSVHHGFAAQARHVLDTIYNLGLGANAENTSGRNVGASELKNEKGK